MPTNNSVQQGQTGTFQSVPNGAVQPGTYSWSVDDTTNVTLTPVASDPTGATVAAAVSATDPNATFTLTVKVTSSNGTVLTDSQIVNVVAAPPVPATAVNIIQLS